MFFLFVFIIILVIIGLIIIIHTSRVGIEVQNLIIDTEQPQGKKINEESKINVYILIFGKIKIFKNNVKNMKRPDFKIKNKNIDIKILQDKDLKINYKSLLKNIDLDIEKIDLNAQIGTEDAVLTAILVGIISSILGILIKKPKYQVIPIYTNKNFIKIRLDGIFSIYLMQYIDKIIFEKVWHLGQKRKSYK